MLFYILLIFLLLLGIVWVWWKQYVKRKDDQLVNTKTGKNMPGPVPGFLGLNGLWLFLKYGNIGVGKECEKYGPVSRIFIGPYLWIWISGTPEFQELLYKANSYVRGNSFQEILAYILPNNAFTLEGQYWRRHRSMMNQFFSEDVITQGYSEVLKITQTEYEDIVENKSFQFIEFTSRITRKIIMKVIFGYPPQPDKEPLHTVNRGSAGYILFFCYWILYMFVNVIFRLSFIKNYVQKQISEEFGKLLQSIINSPDAKSSLWNQLSKESNSNEDEADDLKTSKFTWEEYIFESLGILAAGFETTATAITWVMYMLHKHPKVLEKLQNEIRLAIGDHQIPNYEETRKITYLDKVIAESMRCNGIVLILGRESVKKDTIGGFTIPIGSEIYSSPTQAARNALPNTKFDPDRISDDDLPELLKVAFLNFGGGPHVCLGKHLALMEIRLITAFLVQKGDIFIQNPELDYAITTHSPTTMPINLSAIKRKL